MSFFYPSITSERRHEDFALQVARGQIPGHRSVVVFGYNGDVDQTEVTVWPYTGLVSHPATAIAMKVSSSNAADTSAGTGARTVLIQGLDADYNEISEVVTLSGQTAVMTTKNYLRINYATVATAGSGQSAAGDIYIGTGTITAGVPATVYNLIKFNYNDTVTGHYTVPAGYTGYLMQGMFTAGQPTGSTSIEGRLVSSTADGIRRTTAIITLNNGTADYAFEYPLPIPEKTDIEATAIGSANNNSCSSMFVILLIAGPNASAPGTPWN
jgi:hypothetical protein